MNSLGMPQDFKPKSFWSKPEGTTGMIFGVGLLGVGAIVLSKILPFLIGLLANTITAVILIVVLICIVTVLLDKRFWNLLWYFYKSAMRQITRVFVEIDPIGILKNYVADLRSNRENMSEQISNLAGQMASLKNLITKNEKDRINNLNIAGEAKKADKNAVFVIKARKAGRLEESNISLKELFTKLEVMYRVLNKMYETSGLLIEDLEDEVNVKSRERESIKAGYSAFKSAMKIVSGDKDKKEMFDQAMDFLAEDYGKKVGEIEHFMSMSKNVIDGIDLQNATYESDALKQLEAWEKRSDNILLGESKQALLADAYNPEKVLDIQATEKERVTIKKKEVKKEKNFKKLLDLLD